MSSSFVTDETPATGFDTQTISTVSLSIAAAKLQIYQAGGFNKKPVKAFVTVETNSIRVRWDGTAPTASVGHLLTAGSSLTIIGESNVTNFRMIRATADAVVMITLYYHT